MPLTPLHVAFVWPLKLRFRRLSFFGLTLGALVPDIENWTMRILQIEPPRLVTHSLLGALTVDIALSLLVWIFIKRFTRLGRRLSAERLDSNFLLSSSLGSLSHVLVDYTHHEYNPILWPFGPTYLTGLLVSSLGQFGADSFMHAVALVLLLITGSYVLRRAGLRTSYLFLSPLRSTRIILRELTKPGSVAALTRAQPFNDHKRDYSE